MQTTSIDAEDPHKKRAKDPRQAGAQGCMAGAERFGVINQMTAATKLGLDVLTL